MKKKVDPKWHLLWEVTKEPLRWVVLGIISWLLTVIIPQLDDSWVGLLTIALRFLDAKIHEIGNKADNDLLVGGITRF